MPKSFNSLRTFAKIKYFCTSEYVKCETKTLASKFNKLKKNFNFKRAFRLFNQDRKARFIMFKEKIPDGNCRRVFFIVCQTDC